MLAYLTASSSVALRLHQNFRWEHRVRHAIEILRRMLTAPSGAVSRKAVDDWATRLAGDSAPEVRARARRLGAMAWPPPSSGSVRLGDCCLGLTGPDGASWRVLHAWHTHCNRLGLNLLEEAAAAWTALGREPENA